MRARLKSPEPLVNIVGREHSLVCQERLQRGQEVIIVLVRHVRVEGCRTRVPGTNLLDQLRAKFIPAVVALLRQKTSHPEHPALPWRIENQLSICHRRLKTPFE